MSNHVELRLMSEFKRPLHLDKGSKEYKDSLNRIRQSISIDDMQSLGLMKAIEMLPFPSGGFDLKYGSFDDGADIRMVGGQLLRTPSAVRIGLFCPLMHSNEVNNRSMRCTPPSAAIIPNFHLPMRSYEVKNRTSTDIKSLRSINMQIKDGADGVIVGGSTGEGQLTSWDEQIVCFGGTTDVGQLTSTPSAVKSATVLPLMHSIKNRRVRCTPPSAAIIPNFHLPMLSYDVKNRTSTDDVKSLRLMTAIRAPYLPDGRFDLETYASLVNIEDGADGVIVGGTTGEGQLIVGGTTGRTINVFGTSIKVIGNTGSNSTREAVHATQQGFAVGMHAALHINPYYGKTSLEGMVAHFKCVLPMGPTVIYNVPSQTGQVIPPRVIHSIADSTNFAGVKVCVGHGRVNEYTKSGITVWSGTMKSVMIQSGTMMLQGLYQLLAIWFWD